MTKNSLNPVARVVIGIVLLVGCAVILIVCTLMFGRVEGEEFNPYLVERRKFHFYELPLVRIQVSSLVQEDSRGSLEVNIVANSYVIPLKGAANDWHLLELNRRGRTTAATDALILVRYFQHSQFSFFTTLARMKAGGGITSDSSQWEKWTEKNPALAKTLWREVFELARCELYVLVPEAFAAAEGAEDAVAFDTELRALLAKRAARYAEEAAERNEADRAGKIAQFILARTPADAQALEIQRKFPAPAAGKPDLTAAKNAEEKIQDIAKDSDQKADDKSAAKNDDGKKASDEEKSK